MEREECIITVYGLVCEHSQVRKGLSPLRRGGGAPALSAEEVLPLELCGQYFQLSTDKDSFCSFRAHSAHFFPRLTARRLFVRQAANLWPVKAALPPRLTQVSGQAADPSQILDPRPLPICGYPRSSRDRGCKPWADSGHSAAKQLAYSGFKLGLRSARSGMIPHLPLVPARPHDLRLLADWGEGFAGLVPAAKGLIAAFRPAGRAPRHGIVGVTPPRKGRTTAHRPPLLKLGARRRKGGETGGAHLPERLAVARLRVHDLWPFHQRLLRTVLAHTVGVFLSLQLGRPPLALDGLVTVES